MNRRLPLGLEVPVVLCVLAARRAAAEPDLAAADEYSLKAAVILNFVRFVEWPQEASGELVIGVLGDDRMAEALESMAAKRPPAGKTVTVRFLKTPRELRLCHVLYLAASMRQHLLRIMEVLRGQPVLTVSDMDGFTASGGVIRLFVEEERIRFDIGLRAAEKGRLKISSRLLGLAKSVDY
jgi:hypothetical protein